jgi:ribosomal protein S18 acetylase RimI-like enzyme
MKLKLHSELTQRLRHKIDENAFERHSIDYVYLRPEHVFVINFLCKEHFWGGIDVTECLQYPDYTCVALYKKLIVGFAFMVPNSAFKEDYLSFIFVHPDWRLSGIATYMFFHMATLNQVNDITLHVSVNSSAVLFYQKFGFKIEEYIKQFYDKYYCEQKHNLMSKDAFLMRLCR